jgi:YhcH/YjgK/YiaL family protein
MNNLKRIKNKFSGLIDPDDSINVEEFNMQYEFNIERWEKAFTFLRDTDLRNIALGRHELEGSDLYASVDEYLTKNEEDARYEAHHKYADIQYVISGEEMIGLLPLGKTQENIPYNEEKDISFLTSAENNYCMATPLKYFIFFPEDAHKPCVKVNENIPVKKMVIKVRI